MSQIAGGVWVKFSKATYLQRLQKDKDQEALQKQRKKAKAVKPKGKGEDVQV